MTKNVSHFFVAALVGFALFYTLGANRTGEQPKVAFNLMLWRSDGKCDHIHHWMVFSLATLVVLAAVWASDGCYQDPRVVIYLGFALGASLEDLTYSDWYRIKEPCQQIQKDTNNAAAK